MGKGQTPGLIRWRPNIIVAMNVFALPPSAHIKAQTPTNTCSRRWMKARAFSGSVGTEPSPDRSLSLGSVRLVVTPRMLLGKRSRRSGKFARPLR
jgi:hypothetical protein